jgi:hypothetical protein
LGQIVSNKEYVACKCISIKEIQKNKYIKQDIENEVKALELLRGSENVVNYIGTTIHESN